MEMKARVKKLWVAALRSGKFKQAKGQLVEIKNGNVKGFCCLGVLCHLHSLAHPKLARQYAGKENYLGEDAFLPKEVMEWAGLTSNDGGTVVIDRHSGVLTFHNDGDSHRRRRAPFKKLADAIEKQL